MHTTLQHTLLTKYAIQGKKVKQKVLMLAFLLIFRRFLVKKDQMAKLVAFRLEVPFVMGIRTHFEGNAFNDIEPIPPQPDNLLGVVCQEPDAANSEVMEDLGADPVVP